ncbi:MAG TPA: flavodoxin family protein [Methanoregulaceae archaeon]|nr:flavodoxin family protein [Methanoregulaceae archaeon]HPD75108.1 flavodoxin family protein [Methanoregulaceae archaeon]HRY75470.1 flavodoxin family protein [Methanoregulaceae archaeon]
MKVLGISGSTRKNGNTARLIKIILKRCEDAGIETKFISLAGKKINPCLGCEKCKKTKWCVIEKDDWGAVAEKVMECEVLVIGSPTYYYDVCGHLKNFIDRTYSLYHDRKLAGRSGVAVAVHASKGATRTVQTIEGFLSTHEFSSLGSVKGTGYEEGAVMKDTEAVKKAEKIGDKIVRLLKPHFD